MMGVMEGCTVNKCESKGNDISYNERWVVVLIMCVYVILIYNKYL